LPAARFDFQEDRIVAAKRLTLGLATGVLMAGSVAAAQAPQTYKGLEVAVSGVTRETNVSLSDCPPGANTQRGVIKPGDDREFALVAVNFKVLPAFKPGPLPKPVLYDEAGTAFNTAQSFADVGPTPTFTCHFAFRVPKGAKVKRFTIDTLSIDVAGK
jgi:hypothetical protein